MRRKCRQNACRWREGREMMKKRHDALFFMLCFWISWWWYQDDIHAQHSSHIHPWNWKVVNLPIQVLELAEVMLDEMLMMMMRWRWDFVWKEGMKRRWWFFDVYTNGSCESPVDRIGMNFENGSQDTFILTLTKSGLSIPPTLVIG